MKKTVELRRIPEEKYSGYRYDVIFKAYKWDPQVGDHNTVAKHAIILDQDTARQLEIYAERLSEETMLMEEALISRPDLIKRLGLPPKIEKNVNRLAGYERSRNIRLMRFDFHPSEDGWVVSEVNSDVPGGLAEASVLPQLTGEFFDDCEPRKHVGQSILDAFSERVRENGTVAFVHATSYSDDRQVMEFLSDYFRDHGYNAVFAAPDHIVWKDRKAFCILNGNEGPVDGIARFFPLEWLTGLPRKSDWKGYFDCETASCNHPVAILTQSKRLPLVWDDLRLDIPAWKSLLPETRDPGTVRQDDPGWIFKPALGRVGEGISIMEAINEKESKLIRKAVRRYPRDWVAQRRFISRPVKDISGEAFHLCIGVFTVNGKSAGFYGRMSPYPRIDFRAEDIPIMVSKG